MSTLAVYPATPDETLAENAWHSSVSHRMPLDLGSALLRVGPDLSATAGRSGRNDDRARSVRTDRLGSAILFRLRSRRPPTPFVQLSVGGAVVPVGGPNHGRCQRPGGQPAACGLVPGFGPIPSGTRNRRTPSLLNRLQSARQSLLTRATAVLGAGRATVPGLHTALQPLRLRGGPLRNFAMHDEPPEAAPGRRYLRFTGGRCLERASIRARRGADLVVKTPTQIDRRAQPYSDRDGIDR